LPTLHTKEVILEKEDVLKAELVIENVDIGVGDTNTTITEKIETTTKGLSAGAPVADLAEALRNL